MLTSSGRVHTISADKLPAGRGHGEPIRLIVEMDQNDDIADMFPHVQGVKRIVASSIGKGFMVAEDELIAQTKAGKQVLNVPKGATAFKTIVVSGDHVAIVGENRKLLVFPLTELPEMKKGQGVKLQQYKGGGIADIKTFVLEEGLSWNLGERTRTETDLLTWIGHRGQVGRMPPNGFPRDNQFGEVE